MKTYDMKMKDIANRGQVGFFDLSRWTDQLGEDTPKIPLNRIGRFRLLQLLRRKFGVNFKNVGQAQQILKVFDTKVKVN